MPFEYGPNDWCILLDDMKRHNFEKIMHLLHDIRQMICYLIPNKKDTHRHIVSDIELPYIKQQFLNKSYDIHKLDKLFCILLEWICKIDPTFEIHNYKWIKQIKSNITTCKNENMSYITILPLVLGGIHSKLLRLIKK